MLQAAPPRRGYVEILSATVNYSPAFYEAPNQEGVRCLKSF
jgi:hypothetical protein